MGAPSTNVCAHCGCTNFERSTVGGDVACINCGTILDENNIVSELGFSEAASGAATIQGSFVGADQAHARGGFNSAFRRHSSFESREQTLSNGKRRIMNLAAVLKIPEFIAEAANRWFQLAVTHNFVQGRRSQYVVSSCLYVACRQQEHTIMLIDFADVLKVNVFAIGATYLKLVKALQIKKIPLIDPSIFIQRFAIELEFDKDTRKVMDDAIRLVQRMGRDWLHQGRRPAGVAGACILVAARMNNYRRTKGEIVHVAKVAEDTIQRRLDEFKLTAAGALTIQAFRGTNIESEADPPSFQRNRRKEQEREEQEAALLEEKEHLLALRAAKREKDLASIAKGDKDALERLAKQDEEYEQEISEEMDATLKDTNFLKLTSKLEIERTAKNSKSTSIDSNIDPILVSKQKESQKFTTKSNTPDLKDSSNSSDEQEKVQKEDTVKSSSEIQLDEKSENNLEKNKDTTEIKDNQNKRKLEDNIAENDDEIENNDETENSDIEKDVEFNTTHSNKKESIDGESETLSDVDDEEIESFMLNEAEVEIKSRVWMGLNRQYLLEQESKRLKIETDEKNGIFKQPRKRRKNKPRDSSSANLPETAADSAKAMIKQRAFSKKINYAAMDHLFSKNSGQKSFSTSSSKSSVNFPDSHFSNVKI